MRNQREGKIQEQKEKEDDGCKVYECGVMMNWSEEECMSVEEMCMSVEGK